MKIKCPVCGSIIEIVSDEVLEELIGKTRLDLPEPIKFDCDVCGTKLDLRKKIYPSASITDVNYYKRKKQEAYEEKRADMMARWNKGELLEKIREKQEETEIEPIEMRRVSLIPDETLAFMDQYLERTIIKMRNDQEMYMICELARQYILDEQAFREDIVHCCNCTIKKAVPHKDGIVWRCPHRTGDVKMEGYCESGVRADGS